MANTTLTNGKSPVTKDSGGTVIGGPDICKTPSPAGPVPVPYPNISQSKHLANGSKTVTIDSSAVCLSSSNFETSTGNEAGVAGGGVMSGKTKGIAEPVNYSFDVKIEGKGIVRNHDLFLGNNKNSPPAPIMQPQLSPSVLAEMAFPEIEPALCPYCGEKEHEFVKNPGSNMGSGAVLSRSIFKGKDIKDHPWYIGPNSLQAHHVICSESMDNDKWYQYCHQFGYNINHKNNGVMLPHIMSLACQLHVPVHRGSHKKGHAYDIDMAYPDAVVETIKEVRKNISKGKFCSNPQKVTQKLNKISIEILSNISTFLWTISSDGKDYQVGGQGCANVSSISNKPQSKCKKNRQHNHRHATTKKTIKAHEEGLKIGY